MGDKEKSLWQLLNSIHSSPETRGLITIESVPLRPFFVRDGDYIFSLIALMGKEKGETKIYRPHSCLVWKYPEMSFIEIINLKNFSLPTVELTANSLANEKICHDLEQSMKNSQAFTLGEEGLEKIYTAIASKYSKENSLIEKLEDSDKKFYELMNKIKQFLLDSGLNVLLEEWKRIYRGMHSYGFCVAVVGEFSRGKSTLINKILGQEILPVGNLLTTAMLTKIAYGPNPGIEYLHKDGRREFLPLENESWDKLVADPFGSNPEGVVKVEVPEEWLGQRGIQVIDTPGAGDLSDKAAQLVTDVLTGCDGAIITISALMALSLTEKAFIEQHLITKKVPHIILVITRLDLVALEQRNQVIDYIKEKLALWKLDIPVYIPQDVLGIEKYQNIVGIEKIKEAIVSWQEDSHHQELKMQSLRLEIKYLLETAQGMLQREKKAWDLSKEEKLALLTEQRNELQKLSLRWEDYRLEMLKRSNHCVALVKKLVEERQELIVERLQFELSHANSPKSWWDNDLPYRLKREVGNVAKGIEDGLKERFSQDLRWLNEAINKDFSTFVGVDNIEQQERRNGLDPKLLNNEMRDTNKLRMFMRAGAGVATIVGYTIFGPFGIIASVGGGIISEILMGKNIEKQKEDLKYLIVEVVRKTLDKAMSTSEKRIQGIYDKAVKEAVRQEKIWFSTQKEIIAKAVSSNGTAENQLNGQLETVQNMIKEINKWGEEE